MKSNRLKCKCTLLIKIQIPFHESCKIYNVKLRNKKDSKYILTYHCAMKSQHVVEKFSSGTVGDGSSTIAKLFPKTLEDAYGHLPVAISTCKYMKD